MNFIMGFVIFGGGQGKATENKVVLFLVGFP
jgi:hypothetical protein